MNAPRDLAAVMADVRAERGFDPAELREAAAAEGRTVSAVACDRMRSRFASDLAGLSGGAWLRMPSQVRETLLALATDRKETRYAAMQSWHSFTDAERRSMGAMARFLRRALDEAGWLKP